MNASKSDNVANLEIKIGSVKLHQCTTEISNFGMNTMDISSVCCALLRMTHKARISLKEHYGFLFYSFRV